MMNDTIIQASNLCMQSGKKFLLRNINWTVKAGEHWLVFGMNGSGKTTLLSAVAGFKCPTKGTLEVLGHTYNNENIFALRKKVGWVSSSFFECVFIAGACAGNCVIGAFRHIGYPVQYYRQRCAQGQGAAAGAAAAG